jgi:signal transduction histidine kinase
MHRSPQALELADPKHSGKTLSPAERELMEVCERERRRVAQEMHDGLCQQLIGAAFLAKALAENSPPDAAHAQRLHELVKVINAAIRETRALNLPAAIATGNLGLYAGLKSLVATAGEIEVSLDCPERLDLGDGATALQLFRIAQEAFLNAIQHSCGSRVKVCVSETKRAVTLFVEDDGRGRADAILENARIGLKLMQIRARAISATLRFEPSDAGGIRVSCDVPLCP